MEIELFLKTYTPMMMGIVKKFSEMETNNICNVIRNGSHNQLLKLNNQIEDLAKAKMLLEQYDGCDICFDQNCESDHK